MSSYRFQPDMMKRRFCRPAEMRLVAPSARASSFDGEVLDRDFPPVTHPLVYTQAETGRKVLNLAPMFAVGIEDMDPAEGDALMERLIAHCTRATYAYWHRWRAGDMVIWDNWRTLHSGEGVPPAIYTPDATHEPKGRLRAGTDGRSGCAIGLGLDQTAFSQRVERQA